MVEGAFQIQLCIPATHDTFQFCVIASSSYDEYTALVKKRRKQTRQRMESAIETSDLKLSGDLVQTSKNCDAKHGRTFNSSAADLNKRWHETGRSYGSVFWWKTGYCDLLSYVKFLLDGWPVFCCFFLQHA